ncbi:hypothetical protein DFJ77DRAFT_539991 [Powellomyces hirtus]|nr:hypothetical protein DFJ77DRAFT_539991 [Powellomyces hirtus]
MSAAEDVVVVIVVEQVIIDDDKEEEEEPVVVESEDDGAENRNIGSGIIAGQYGGQKHRFDITDHNTFAHLRAARSASHPNFGGNAAIDRQVVPLFQQSKAALIMMSEEAAYAATIGHFVAQHPVTQYVDDLSGVMTVGWPLVVPVTVVNNLVQSMRSHMKLMTDMLDEMDLRPGDAGPVRAYEAASFSG